MDLISRDRVEQLAKDISFVKNAIDRNLSILRQISYRTSLRLVTLISSLSIFIFCTVAHFLLQHYKKIENIPFVIKISFVVTFVVVLFIIGFQKKKNILRSANSIKPNFTIINLLKEYYTLRILNHFIPIVLVLAFLCTMAAVTRNYNFIIPTFSIGIGILLNNLNLLLRINEFLLTSYWLIVTGSVILVFRTISPTFSICLTIGCALFLLSIIWYWPSKKNSEKSDSGI